MYCGGKEQLMQRLLKLMLPPCVNKSRRSGCGMMNCRRCLMQTGIGGGQRLDLLMCRVLGLRLSGTMVSVFSRPTGSSINSNAGKVSISDDGLKNA